MTEGNVRIFTGDGHGKTPAALGEALYAAATGKQVVVIQFLKANEISGNEFFARLEPEIKFFRFEKSSCDYEDLSEKERAEENKNIRNGVNFAKKVLSTGGCDLLILDEILGLLDMGIISVADLKELLSVKSEETQVILTGIQLQDEVVSLADSISKIVSV
ncbi:MAG: cob(I)yrinic acid a,c-diamide adenosyltransferase [Lachnospiraceae bacterium]|nr:cob(I)yrinic acid a,c-diamide adenosyltransferase [Lachnospiraceae bacterium]